MKKYVLILLCIVFFILTGCSSPKPKLCELGDLHAVVIDKYLNKTYSHGGTAYLLIIAVKVDTCTYRYAVNPELYETYSVGDTIKYIGMKYE